jgi:ornithine carbamoyltransferase
MYSRKKGGSKVLRTKDFLTGLEINAEELTNLLKLAKVLKDKRNEGLGRYLLKGKTLAMLFDKPSLRTRLSFTVAMQELGGSVIDSISSSRKSEEPQDLARVIQGYCHAIMIRTFSDNDVAAMAKATHIPVINGLSDQFHPCQSLADLLTVSEQHTDLSKITLAYIGDGNNILQSLVPLAALTNLKIHYACPRGYGPKTEVVEPFLKSEKAKAFDTPADAIKGADVVYTDVWASMGFESETAARKEAFAGFQVNEDLISKSGKNTKVMHCLPMIRGEEISNTLPDSPVSLIFQQSENRLHVQKALLLALFAKQIGEENVQKLIGH